MRRTLIAALILAVLLSPLASAKPASAQSGNQWTGFYFNNQDWAGTPVQTQTLSAIAFNWGLGSPGPSVPVDFFTGRFDSNAYFYAGTYRFTVTADDEVTLIIGGITYVDTRNQGQSGKTITVDVTFPDSSNRQVTLFYRELTQTAYVWLDWQPVKGGVAPPPPATPPAQSCGPQSATSVQTQFGDYTPCIQQGLHQSACFQSNGAWNAPNMGSIQTEPAIQVWGNCASDSITNFQVSCNLEEPQQAFKCSKTEAGWFPN